MTNRTPPTPTELEAGGVRKKEFELDCKHEYWEKAVNALVKRCFICGIWRSGLENRELNTKEVHRFILGGIRFNGTPELLEPPAQKEERG